AGGDETASRGKRQPSREGPDGSEPSLAGACPRGAPEPPSTANDRRQKQPLNLKPARALKLASNARDTLVMRGHLFGGDVSVRSSLRAGLLTICTASTTRLHGRGVTLTRWDLEVRCRGRMRSEGGKRQRHNVALACPAREAPRMTGPEG